MILAVIHRCLNHLQRIFTTIDEIDLDVEILVAVHQAPRLIRTAKLDIGEMGHPSFQEKLKK